MQSKAAYLHLIYKIISNNRVIIKQINDSEIKGIIYEANDIHVEYSTTRNVTNKIGTLE